MKDVTLIGIDRFCRKFCLRLKGSNLWTQLASERSKVLEC